MSEEEKRAYFECIDAAKVEELENLLPSSDYAFFKQVMYYIINELYGTYVEYRALLDSADHESVQEVLDEIILKLKICLQHYNPERYSFKGVKHKIVFGTTFAGNFRIENDLKHVPKDRHLRKVFSYILDGVDETDSTKYVYYPSINADLNGICKYKDYQTRIYAVKIYGDIVYVFAIYIKKSTRNFDLDSRAARRYKESLAEIQRLKVLLADEKQRDLILSRSHDFLEGLLDEIGYVAPSDDSFDIATVEEFLSEELEADYSLSFEEKENEFDFYVMIGLEIIRKYGFLNLEDEEAQKVNLGAWLDTQIKKAGSFLLTDDELSELLLLMTNLKTRLSFLKKPNSKREPRPYPLSNIPGMKIDGVDISNGFATFSAVNDYYFENVSRNKWLDFYIVARELYDEKGFVDLNDERAKSIDLGRWLDLQIRYLFEGKLTSEQEECLFDFVSNAGTRSMYNESSSVKQSRGK